MARQQTWAEDQIEVGMKAARPSQWMNERRQPKKSTGGLANALGWFSIGLGAVVVGVTLFDRLSSRQSSHPNGEKTNGRQNGGITAQLPWNQTLHVQKAITINRPPEEVYGFWRDFQNLPRFMKHLESVQVTGERRSHWRTKAPAGTTVEWDAEIINDEPNHLIAWQSVEGADVDNSGMVRFIPAPHGQGTEVHVQIHYNPPGGVIGAAVAKLFGEAPDQQMQDDLRRFKQVLETGEVVQSDASIHSHPHPAQPSAEPVMSKSDQTSRHL